ncbi:Enoyl-CoA hydratase/isomerase [Dokdonella koreensis DS-123]|uniref:Enoyl-CoA hydratase/isomerase n=2 Tax=Dokdonella TaxID=323413 RepID=A0A160DTF9_9GAMM|nr:Enoyl-CoA hydratase/isomerase [Dokdonella koreensis DS-123]
MRDTNDYQLLRTHEDEGTHASWFFMHKHQPQHDLGYRACFSVQLLKELHLYLRSSVEQAMPVGTGQDGKLAHLVLGSDADVFNLGGDLELFGRLIRERNREHLLSYARLCVEGVHGVYAAAATHKVHSIALVQGDALGGGLELALACQTIVAESGVGMGFPEVLFDLFPGMGAYSFLRQRISAKLAEEMILSGNVYSSDELHAMGVVDVLVPRGEGVQAVNDLIRRNQRIPHARVAMNRVRQACNPVTLDELMRVTEIWVDTAMELGDKSLRTMERLVRVQQRKPQAAAERADLARPALQAV